MVLTVRVWDWELEESGRILSIGDEVRSWLTFEETRPGAPASETVSVVRGVAVPLPAWPGAGLGRHPARIDVEGGSLYWDAPEPVAGSIEVEAVISTNNVDAPEGFPETSGVVRRVRMMWDFFVFGPEGFWRGTGEPTRYEEVTSTYVPAREPTTLDPDVEAELRRQAQDAYAREVAAGRRGPGDVFRVALHVPASTRNVPAAGTTSTSWTGVVIDLETAG
jgi:hypothetical protein